MFRELLHRPLTSFLDVYPSLASVLYFYGVDFSKNKEHSLTQICKQHKLDLNNVVERFENNLELKDLSSINQFPLDITLSYLKHAHKNYTKYKIPFCLEVLKLIKPSCDKIHDIKFIFPIFAEDFVQHIIEEEQSTFKEIEQLLNIKNHNVSDYDTFLFLENNKIEQEFELHLEEDEFKGLRELTNNYDPTFCNSLEEKILFQELEHLDKDITRHALIENEILFPRIIATIEETKDVLLQKALLN